MIPERRIGLLSQRLARVMDRVVGRVEWIREMVRWVGYGCEEGRMEMKKEKRKVEVQCEGCGRILVVTLHPGIKKESIKGIMCPYCVPLRWKRKRREKFYGPSFLLD